MAQVACESVLNVEISDSGTYTQEMICGGEVQILLIKLGPLRCSHMRPTQIVSNTIGDTCIILDVDIELL
jgi:hypothetical protein